MKVTLYVLAALMLAFYTWSKVGYPMYMRYQTSNWSSTEAVVTQSELDCYTDQGVKHCTAVIRADYTVGEQTYQAGAVPAHGIESMPELDLMRDQEASIAALPVGATVTLFVNPSNAAQATFHRAPTIDWFEWLFTMALLIGVGWWLASGRYPRSPV